jgi:hypothetical protein
MGICRAHRNVAGDTRSESSCTAGDNLVGKAARTWNGRRSEATAVFGNLLNSIVYCKLLSFRSNLTLGDGRDMGTTPATRR